MVAETRIAAIRHSSQIIFGRDSRLDAVTCIVVAPLTAAYKFVIAVESLASGYNYNKAVTRVINLKMPVDTYVAQTEWG